MPRPLDEEEVARQLRDLPAWTGDVRGLHRDVRAPDYRTAVRVVVEVADVAEEVDHHPDVHLGWRALRIDLVTHDRGAVTQLDVELAHRVEEVLRDHGCS